MTTVSKYVRMSKCTGWVLSTREEKINAGERTDTHRLARGTLEFETSNHQRSEALEQFLDGVRIQD